MLQMREETLCLNIDVNICMEHKSNACVQRILLIFLSTLMRMQPLPHDKQERKNHRQESNAIHRIRHEHLAELTISRCSELSVHYLVSEGRVKSSFNYFTNNRY